MISIHFTWTFTESAMRHAFVKIFSGSFFYYDRRSEQRNSFLWINYTRKQHKDCTLYLSFDSIFSFKTQRRKVGVECLGICQARYFFLASKRVHDSWMADLTLLKGPSGRPSADVWYEDQNCLGRFIHLTHPPATVFEIAFWFEWENIKWTFRWSKRFYV